jgi:two-component system, LuxR family, response regulator FixJ
MNAKALRPNVAVIDDDEAVRDSLKLLLEIVGYSVWTYPSAARFLAETLSPWVCLIIDHHMPQMTGLELISLLRSRGSRIPAALITASSSPEMARRAAQLSATLFDKPVAEEDLMHFIATAQRRPK